MLVNNKFISWDVIPKINFSDPSRPPIINQYVTHKWYKTYVKAKHSFINGNVIKLKANIKNFNSENKIVTFFQQEGNIKYIVLNLINTKTYELIYETYQNNVHSRISVWMKLV